MGLELMGLERQGLRCDMLFCCDFWWGWQELLGL